MGIQASNGGVVGSPPITDGNNRYGSKDWRQACEADRGAFAAGIDFSVTTLEEEARLTADSAPGWTRNQMPTGAHSPPDAIVAGMRGEDFDSDPHYGIPDPTNGAPKK